VYEQEREHSVRRRFVRSLARSLIRFRRFPILSDMTRVTRRHNLMKYLTSTSTRNPFQSTGMSVMRCREEDRTGSANRRSRKVLRYLVRIVCVSRFDRQERIR